jgi:hypothetical protein
LGEEDERGKWGACQTHKLGEEDAYMRCTGVGQVAILWQKTHTCQCQEMSQMLRARPVRMETYLDSLLENMLRGNVNFGDDEEHGHFEG